MSEQVRFKEAQIIHTYLAGQFPWLVQGPESETEEVNGGDTVDALTGIYNTLGEIRAKHQLELMVWRIAGDDDDSLCMKVLPEGEESTLLAEQLEHYEVEPRTDDNETYYVTDNRFLTDGEIFQVGERKFRLNITEVTE